MKKILSAFVALAFLATAMPAFAAEPAPGGGAATDQTAPKTTKKSTKKATKKSTKKGAKKTDSKDKEMAPPATK